MGKVKSWLMDMEEDASFMSLDEWVSKHGEQNKDVYETIQGDIQMNSTYNNLSVKTTDEILSNNVAELQMQLNEAHTRIHKLHDVIEEMKQLSQSSVDNLMKAIDGSNKRWTNIGEYYDWPK
tara:strand:- start:276 stop:641 length:366 start_codon:yes stop_codon:yes gene_type:complete